MHLRFKDMLPNPLQSADETRVILVRHGESTFNAEGRHQGSSDLSELTEVGHWAAHRTGDFLRGLPIDAWYCSPLTRAQQTANHILSEWQHQEPEAQRTAPLMPVLLSHLREIDLPTWQGLTHRYIQAQFPEDYRCWKQSPQTFSMTTEAGTCFPIVDLYARANEFWQMMLPLHRGKTLMVVAHAGTNRALINTALGLPPANYHALQQSNCGVSMLRFAQAEQQQGHLEALNWTGHLGESLPQPKGGERGLRLLLVPTPTSHWQVQRAIDLLQEIKIQFSVADSQSGSGAIAQQLLQTHPETVNLQVWGPDFLRRWQEAIASRLGINQGSHPFMTGLVVAERSRLQQFLATELGLGAPPPERLELHPGTISVLHYAEPKTLPMLQALNLSIRHGLKHPVPFSSELAA